MAAAQRRRNEIPQSAYGGNNTRDIVITLCVIVYCMNREQAYENIGENCVRIRFSSYSTVTETRFISGNTYCRKNEKQKKKEISNFFFPPPKSPAFLVNVECLDDIRAYRFTNGWKV